MNKIDINQPYRAAHKDRQIRLYTDKGGDPEYPIVGECRDRTGRNRQWGEWEITRWSADGVQEDGDDDLEIVNAHPLWTGTVWIGPEGQVSGSYVVDFRQIQATETESK